MTAIDSIGATLQDRLNQLAREHDVVGAQIAVRQGDTVVEAATGVTNRRTGVEVTTDTVFQIGSISKVYTATLVMQLVDEGRLDLDAPVSRYLDDFALADPAAAAGVTIRQLLTHTSGIDGDIFDDFGRGDDCVQRFVAGMSGLSQTNPAGTFSYCNSGFILAGRLIEHFRGTSWDAALRQHLLEPLGVRDTVTLPEEAILRRAAIGHLPTGPDGALEVAPVYFMARAVGPAGVITAPAREVLTFARMHLDDGKASDGKQVLSPASVKAMRELQVRLPDPAVLGDGWGLGWILYTLNNPQVIGHDGGTIGQGAFLRVVPDHDLAVALLTNGGGIGGLFDALVPSLLDELGGARLNEHPVPPSPRLELDVTPFLGVYERSGIRMTVRRDEDQRLWLSGVATGPLAGTMPDEPPRELVALDATRLITVEPDKRLGHHVTVAFLDPDRSGFSYVHMGGRATPRVADQP